MRIRFIRSRGYKAEGTVAVYSDEYQVTINAKGNTVFNGRRIARDGVLCGDVEDITQYTLDEEGNKVEVVPEVEIEGVPI